MAVKVAFSTVKNGSMGNGANPIDQSVIKNREKWFSSLGLSIDDATKVRLTYTEGDETFINYRIVDESEKGAGMRDNNVQKADALVTTTPGHALFLMVADCIATTLYDEERGVLMLSHLGRHNLEKNGGELSVKYLVDNFGSDPAKLKVWLSASIGKDKYPIHNLDGKGMKEVAYEQLAAAGILTSNIIDNTADTGTHEDYYSHSEFLKDNEAKEGRQAMVAVII